MARREEELEEALRLLREGAPLEAVVARYPEPAPDSGCLLYTSPSPRDS